MLLSFLSLLSVAASPFNLSQANLLQSDSQIDFSPTRQQIVQTQIAQTQIAQNQSNIITVPQTVRPLPGGLDTVPVFNSNSPEIIESDGILLSTFPSRGKSAPSAHLNYPLSGRFDIFSHHVARGQTTATIALSTKGSLCTIQAIALSPYRFEKALHTLAKSLPGIRSLLAPQICTAIIFLVQVAE